MPRPDNERQSLSVLISISVASTSSSRLHGPVSSPTACRAGAQRQAGSRRGSSREELYGVFRLECRGDLCHRLRAAGCALAEHVTNDRRARTDLCLERDVGIHPLLDVHRQASLLRVRACRVSLATPCTWCSCHLHAYGSLCSVNALTYWKVHRRAQHSPWNFLSFGVTPGITSVLIVPDVVTLDL